MINSNEYYSEKLSEFVKQPYLIQLWFFERGWFRSADEIAEFYQVIKNMWFTHRDDFSSKGQYKMIRRMFVKYAASSLSNRNYAWKDLPADLCKEMLDKVNQHWISYVYEVDENMWNTLVRKSQGYTGDRLYPVYRF